MSGRDEGQQSTRDGVGALVRYGPRTDPVLSMVALSTRVCERRSERGAFRRPCVMLQMVPATYNIGDKLDRRMSGPGASQSASADGEKQRAARSRRSAARPAVAAGFIGPCSPSEPCPVGAPVA